MGSESHRDTVDMNNIYINGIKVTRVNSVKYLEVHIDCHLNQKDIAVKRKMTICSIINIRNIRRSLTVKAAHNLVLGTVSL